LNATATRIRHLAKSTIQKWLTLNIMSEFDLTAPNSKIIGKLSKLTKAARDGDLSFLGAHRVEKLAAQNKVPVAALKEALETQLARM
jgi:hypothetical protein